MKIKTSELTGAALDWAVAKCEGIRKPDLVGGFDGIGNYSEPWEPSTNWSQGGPIIEREFIDLMGDEFLVGQHNAWAAINEREAAQYECFGPTPLIAAMRCYVASKLGDEVEIPDELQ